MENTAEVEIGPKIWMEGIFSPNLQQLYKESIYCDQRSMLIVELRKRPNGS